MTIGGANCALGPTSATGAGAKRSLTTERSRKARLAAAFGSALGPSLAWCGGGMQSPAHHRDEWKEGTGSGLD